jgi:hypothetical protein
VDPSTLTIAEEIDLKRMTNCKTVIVVLPIYRLEIKTSIHQSKHLNIHLKEVCASNLVSADDSASDGYQQIEISLLGPNNPQVMGFLKCLKSAKGGLAKGSDDQNSSTVG